MSAASPETSIAESIRRATGDWPVLLGGSRAVGTARETSDYDVFVVLPALRVPLAVPRLKRAAETLGRSMGIQATINPIPRFRLEHADRNLLVWKLKQEGRVIAAPAGFSLRRPGPPPLTAAWVSSYAISGLRYLIERLQPAALRQPQIPEGVRHDVEKALLHAAQLELLAQGSYVSALEEALERLESLGVDELPELIRASGAPRTWLRARDVLVSKTIDDTGSRAAALVSNAQYLVLSVLRGRRPEFRVLASRESVGASLRRAVIGLALAVGPDGEIVARRLQQARESLPPAIRPGDDTSWSDVRDAIDREWDQANPLLGL